MTTNLRNRNVRHSNCLHSHLTPVKNVTGKEEKKERGTGTMWHWLKRYWKNGSTEIRKCCEQKDSFQQRITIRGPSSERRGGTKTCLSPCFSVHCPRAATCYSNDAASTSLTACPLPTKRIVHVVSMCNSACQFTVKSSNYSYKTGKKKKWSILVHLYNSRIPQ